MLRANWLEQGSSLQRHPLLRVHLELVLQPMQLPCHPKHPSDKPARSGTAGASVPDIKPVVNKLDAKGQCLTQERSFAQGLHRSSREE
jgi:hypothetical protein